MWCFPSIAPQKISKEMLILNYQLVHNLITHTKRCLTQQQKVTNTKNLKCRANYFLNVIPLLNHQCTRMVKIITNTLDFWKMAYCELTCRVHLYVDKPQPLNISCHQSLPPGTWNSSDFFIQGSSWAIRQFSRLQDNMKCTQAIKMYSRPTRIKMKVWHGSLMVKIVFCESKFKDGHFNV